MPSLFAAALGVLTEPDVHRKAELTVQMAEDWRAGRLRLELEAGDEPSSVPMRPARPAGVTTVPSAKTKGSKSLKAAIHALVHAESYAIDLSVDIMARFGWSPATWGVPAHEGELDAAAVAIAAGGDPAPCMPPAFFDDWTQVAEEEALHFRRWLERLRAHGGQYGDLPTHDSLWESAEQTAYSLGARLAVVHCTHEARGLDTAPAFLARLEGAGDAASAGVLRANVGQEVHHVRRGREWLQWVADRAGRGDEAPLVYQTLARRHFKGLLRPPYNDADRDVAGLTRAWWEPLTRPASPAPGEAAPGDGEVAPGGVEDAPGGVEVAAA